MILNFCFTVLIFCFISVSARSSRQPVWSSRGERALLVRYWGRKWNFTRTPEASAPCPFLPQNGHCPPHVTDLFLLDCEVNTKWQLRERDSSRSGFCGTDLPMCEAGPSTLLTATSVHKSTT